MYKQYNILKGHIYTHTHTHQVTHKQHTVSSPATTNAQHPTQTYQYTLIEKLGWLHTALSRTKTPLSPYPIHYWEPQLLDKNLLHPPSNPPGVVTFIVIHTMISYFLNNVPHPHLAEDGVYLSYF